MAKIIRFFMQNIPKGQIVSITGDEARHMKVLRLQKGDKICLFDSTGNEAIGRIFTTELQKIQIKVDTREKVSSDRILIDLAVSIPKGKRWDWLIQKATELGARKIMPILTKRGIVIPKKKGKSERWQRIAIEAAKQSQRGTIPQVTEAAKFDDFIDISDEYDIMLIAIPNAKQHIKHALQKKGPTRILCMIGPEGGFTDEEEDKAIKKGFTPVNLGKEILRIETAGMAMLAMIKYECEE